MRRREGPAGTGRVIAFVVPLPRVARLTWRRWGASLTRKADHRAATKGRARVCEPAVSTPSSIARVRSVRRRACAGGGTNPDTPWPQVAGGRAAESAVASAGRRQLAPAVSDHRMWLGWVACLARFPAPAVVVLASDCFAVAGDSTHPVVSGAAIFAGFVAVP
jgi:hypothetical protein